MMYGSNPFGVCFWAIGTIVAGFGVAAYAERPANRPAKRPLVYQTNNGAIHAGDQVFQSWSEYAASDYFYDQGKRCGLEVNPDDGGFAGLGGGQADCSAGLTNPAEIYDPSVTLYRIPVVVHVIRNDAGTLGNISEAMVNSQIKVLNEDFLALPGTNGEPGTDVQIEFFLATEDPDGNPTNGITYSNNTTWFNDGGAYYNTLAWDPFHYLNIYTTTAGGALGYVPFLPQGGAVGANSDRVVCLWSAFGRNAPIGHPFNLGRTVTHEVGHYLGLYHTFQNGCGTTQCYITGDRICDTNSEANPHFGCPVSNSCGTLDPVHNYMDYGDDPCMWEFTPEQARRMRCTLEHWRPDLAVVAQENTVIADTVEIVRGVLVDGDVTDLADSDDERLLVNSGITVQAGEPPVWVVVDATAPSDPPSAMRFVVESRVNTPGTSQTLELFNYDTNAFEQVDVRTAGLADQVVEVELTGDLSRFIEAGSQSMQAQLSYHPPLLTLVYPWQVGLDQVVWVVAP